MNNTTIFQIFAGILIVYVIVQMMQKMKEQKKVKALLSQRELKELQVVDVRTVAEFKASNVPGSLNIPLDQLLNCVQKLDLSDSILVCCNSGARSSVAKKLLLRQGAKHVLNAGSWRSLISHR